MKRYIIPITREYFYYMTMNNLRPIDRDGAEMLLLPQLDYQIGDLVTLQTNISHAFYSRDGRHDFYLTKTYKILEIAEPRIDTIFAELEEGKTVISGVYCDHTKLFPEEQALIEVVDSTLDNQDDGGQE